jgi:hypothetical protein
VRQEYLRGEALLTWSVIPGVRQSDLFIRRTSEKVSTDLTALDKKGWRPITELLTGYYVFRRRLFLRTLLKVSIAGNVDRRRDLCSLCPTLAGCILYIVGSAWM